MIHLKSLIKRDIKIFYRTKGNIIFASLSVMILVVLHFLIFRNMFTDSWAEIIAQFPITVEREQLAWIVDNLMFSAVVPMGAVTISLVALGLMVADKEKNVLSDFLVSPIGRKTLLASYLISSFIVGLVILLLFIAFFEVYFLAVYGMGFTLIQFGLILLATIGSLIFANVFMLLLVTFVKSQQSLGALGTILGTLLGFLSGAYIPVGQFGETIGNIFSALPFLQMTVLTRQAFLYELANKTPLTYEMLSGGLARSFGIELWIGDRLMPIWAVILILGLVTAVLLAALVIRFSKMKKAD